MLTLFTWAGKLSRAHRMLTITGLLMIPTTMVCIAGLLLDPRIIAGSPAWLKPAKFAISIMIYTLTLAWIFGRARLLSRWQQRVGSVVAWALLIEQVVITLQAARGTTSHFNVSSSLNAALFSTMGVAIGVLLVGSLIITIELWRQNFDDPAWKWALRLAMLLSLAGASVGGLMLRPSADQLLNASKTHQLSIVGGHSIGGVDGSAELPVIHWNAKSGDLRAPHFLGLHVLQALPLFLLLIDRLRPSLPGEKRKYLVLLFASSYSALVAILMLQALRGLPITSVDQPIALALCLWASGTLCCALQLFTTRQASQLKAQTV